MDFPKLKGTEIAVLICKAETGVVLKEDLTIKIGTENSYIVFDNLVKAKEYSNELIRKHPELEIILLKENNVFVETIAFKPK